jgi:hypothetical protein
MSLLTLPDQSIPEKEKNQEWHILHALEYARSTGVSGDNSQRKEIEKLYRAYFAELTDEEIASTKSITCPNGNDLGVEYVVYPLIQTKIEQIVGEFLLRPIRRKAYVLDEKSQNAKFEEKLKMLSEEIMRGVTEKLQPELGFTPETEHKDIELPPDIEEFFEKDFKMLQEEVADNLIALFLDVRKEKSKFKDIFLDYCISDRAHVVLDKRHGHTTMRKVHPLDPHYDSDPYKVVQDDHEFFFENYWLTENEIYNTFTLTADQKRKVKEFFKNNTGHRQEAGEDSEALTHHNKYDGWFESNNRVHRMRIVNGMWKSRKTIPIKVTENKKTGKKIYKKLDDEKQARKKDKIERIEKEIPRFVQMLGPDICLDWGVMEQRLSSKENPYECELPVVSIIRENSVGSAKIKSIAAKLYQLQEIASEILFEIRLAIKHMGDSRVLVYDAAQTPKEFVSQEGYEGGLNRVMHHIKKDKLMVINSKDKAHQRNTFNQFTSLDLSQKGAVQDLFTALGIVEDLASKFVGITPEREGQIGQYQTATGTDKAIRGSSARTEVIYSPFDDLIQAVLDKFLKKAKHDYKDSKIIQYVFGEMKTKFMRIYEDYFDSDFGVYLSDARKDKEASERIDAAAEMALSNANSPDMVMGLIEVFEGESANEKKAVFGRMLNAMEKRRQEAEAAQAEQAKAMQEAEQAAQEQDLLKSREGNETEIEVAKIYANSKANSDNVKASSAELIKAAELEQQQKQEAEKE